VFIGQEGYKDEAPFDPSMSGRNFSDCSPKQPGWFISESVWTVNYSKKRMKFYSRNIVKNNVKKYFFSKPLISYLIFVNTFILYLEVQVGSKNNSLNYLRNTTLIL